MLLHLKCKSHDLTRTKGPNVRCLLHTTDIASNCRFSPDVLVLVRFHLTLGTVLVILLLLLYAFGFLQRETLVNCAKKFSKQTECVRSFERGNENNNIICKELTMVYCSNASEGSLKSPACVISGKLLSVAFVNVFFRSRFRCERKFPQCSRICVVFMHF